MLWAEFINAERKEEFDMLAEKNPYISRAYQQLQIISQDKEKRLEYEAREKAIFDHNQLILEAKERGKQEEAFRITKNMLLENFDTNVIAKISGLSIKQILSLKNEQ